MFLHQQALDTSTPSSRALFQMLGVFAEFEVAMIGERTRAELMRCAGAGQTSWPAAQRPAGATDLARPREKCFNHSTPVMRD